MDLRATKTHGERQDEEAERLVRPAPKLKPPRRDRRRERMEVDDDEEEEDKDLSHNFKTIGGSLQERISWRYMIAAPKTPKLKVRNRETNKVVNVTEETLKAEPGKYEKIDESEEDSDPKSFERGEALRSLTKDDPKLDGAFKSLLNPKSDLGGLAETNPSLPAKSVFKTVQLPEGVETIGDMVKALRGKAPKAKPKPETAPVETPIEEAKTPAEEAKKQRFQKKPPPAPPAEAPAVPAEAPKGDAPKADAPAAEAPAEAPKGDAKAPEEGKPAEAPPKEEGAKGEAAPPAKKKKKAPKPTEEGAPAEGEAEPAPPPEPSEAEKAGVPPPKRREASEFERMEAQALIMDTFPPEVATDLLARNIHPDDVSSLVDAYHTSKSFSLKGSSPTEFAENASSFYELDPDRVKPPKTGKNAEGKVVAFDELTPDEKGEAMRKHQMRVVAMSLAAKDVLTRELSMPSWSGKAQIPRDLAATAATFMLRKGGEESGKRLSEKMFQSALGVADYNDDGTPAKPLSPKIVQGLFKHLTPGAKALAVGFLQARDYHHAKAEFLGSGDISERSRPRDIFATMKRAKAFFEDRSKLYGASTEGPHRAQSTFQVRLLSKLRALAPDSYKGVRQLMATDQKDTYDREKAKYEKDLKAWEERKKAWEAKQPAYRGEPFSEARPEEPRKPPLYHLAVDPKQTRRDAQQMWDEATTKPAKDKKPEDEKASGEKSKEETESKEPAKDEKDSKTKTAASILRRFTYPCAQTMGQGSDKTGVYHGVDPKAQYPAAYPGWQQGHQRDFGRADFEAILGAARDWLKAPVLSTAVEGIVPDQQFRAALDLAIRDSKFDGQIQPGVYNELLSKLAGEPKPGIGQTLTTVREARDSSFGSSKKGTPMKVSRELRALAAKVASTDIAAASEMIALAEQIEATPSAPASAPAPKVAATDERFTKLKNLVIRTAAADAEAKKVLLPVLQEIKNLG